MIAHNLRLQSLKLRSLKEEMEFSGSFTKNHQLENNLEVRDIHDVFEGKKSEKANY